MSSNPLSAIAIQGYAGSFHEQAARLHFGAAPALQPCATFQEVVQRVADGRASAGLMAIENTLAGSILPNYLLLQQGTVRVTGEIYLPIRQHLLALPGQTLADIKEVHSHPMALRQCGPFLDQHSWRLVETDDTGRSAQRVRDELQWGVAAVAGEQAAHLFGLELLAPDIHADPGNYTRFLALAPASTEAPALPQADKASLYFHTAHAPGTLARVLTRIAGHGLNLTKLQSSPRPGQPWHYSFHIDVEFDNVYHLHELLAELPELTEDLQVLGIYHRGEMNELLPTPTESTAACY
ncbi:chorismate mutase [Hymenobacter lutimineralis]|uniref:prephenate dehydratase n=1 Tax=Hymenobacter lutimineralis TaxID=2606448 RepID=A0A5D6V9R8_9BACT|nr:prephenate dehydratase domain-containing protein [Hymenobacter lutimineralis]TYZ11414.1 chorismate mutase [Hymenobacter lutimineralis]